MLDLPIEAILQAGAGGLVVIFVLAILSGRLVPRRVLLDTQAERDYWRNAAMGTLKQNGQLVEGVAVVKDVLRALPVPKRPTDGDEADA